MQSIGRYGAWKYSSMQEAVLDGKTAAENLLKETQKTIAPSKIQVVPESNRKEIIHDIQ